VPVTEFVDTPVPETTAPALSGVPDSAAEDNSVSSSPAPTATTKPPTPQPTSVETVIPGETLEPVATAARIFPLSWSPDSETLAYWTFTDEEIALDFTLPPGTLNFFNISTGESCQSTVEVGYGYLSPTLVWLPDGGVQVLVEQGAIEGTPCKDDFKVADGSQNNTISDPSLSPGGDVRVNTVEIEPARFRTTLTSETTGELLATVDWQTIAALGEPDDGGQWLTHDAFLIHETMEGPLLVSTDGEVILVASQYFNQSVEAYCDGVECQMTLAAIAANAENTDAYHLVLYGGKGVETNFPPIHLYHSENGLVEALDYKQQGGFSPDGQTLLLLSTNFTEKLEYTLALRAVDPPASETFPLLTSTAIHPLPVRWSPDSTMLAANSANDITLFSKFGEVVAKWDVANWATTMPTAWSPNSQHLAVRGFSSSANIPSQEALFVISIQE
jgi:hypothetical protein